MKSKLCQNCRVGKEYSVSCWNLKVFSIFLLCELACNRRSTFQCAAQIRTPNTVFGRIWACIWACQIWSSGVSLKRSCKMQFRRIDLVSIGPPSQKLWPNLIFGWFPHCNYNVKLNSAGGFLFIGLKMWSFLWCIYTPFGSSGPNRIGKFK